MREPFGGWPFLGATTSCFFVGKAHTFECWSSNLLNGKSTGKVELLLDSAMSFDKHLIAVIF